SSWKSPWPAPVADAHNAGTQPKPSPVFSLAFREARGRPAVDSTPERLGRLRRLWHSTRTRDWGGGRDFVRIHLGLADERDAFLHDQLGRADVAEQFGLGLEVQLVLGRDVAVDLAAGHDDLGVDVAGDDRAIAEVQRAFGLDFAFEFSLE